MEKVCHKSSRQEKIKNGKKMCHKSSRQEKIKMGKNVSQIQQAAGQPQEAPESNACAHTHT